MSASGRVKLDAMADPTPPKRAGERTGARPGMTEPSADSNRRAVAFWLVACAAMIFVMVVLGGVTRLTESGLSITEWQPVTGILPPLGDAAWQAEFARYREIPQFKLVHSWMTVEDFKTIFFWEWLHRLWGRLIGVAFALPFLWLLLRRRIPPGLAPRLAGILVLGGLQGVLGWAMVKSGLVDRVEVSQYRLVAHLGLAILLYAAILWTALDLRRREPSAAGNPAGLRRAAAIVAALVFLTVLAGGFVAGLNAGLVYNSFPLMDGRIVPAGYLQLGPWWRNAFENVAAVQFDHRLLAMATLASVVAFAAAARRRDLSRDARRAVAALLALSIVQVGLGIATLLLAVPIPLAAAHQAGAVLLFTAALASRHALGGPAHPLQAFA
jgi:cytochrome c oxidase assembly protein subunit 15